MTVKELIKILEKHDPDLPVVIFWEGQMKDLEDESYVSVETYMNDEEEPTRALVLDGDYLHYDNKGRLG